MSAVGLTNHCYLIFDRQMSNAGGGGGGGGGGGTGGGGGGGGVTGKSPPPREPSLACIGDRYRSDLKQALHSFFIGGGSATGNGRDLPVPLLSIIAGYLLLPQLTLSGRFVWSSEEDWLPPRHAYRLTEPPAGDQEPAPPQPQPQARAGMTSAGAPITILPPRAPPTRPRYRKSYGDPLGVAYAHGRLYVQGMPHGGVRILPYDDVSSDADDEEEEARRITRKDDAEDKRDWHLYEQQDDGGGAEQTVMATVPFASCVVTSHSDLPVPYPVDRVHSRHGRLEKERRKRTEEKEAAAAAASRTKRAAGGGDGDSNGSGGIITPIINEPVHHLPSLMMLVVILLMMAMSGPIIKSMIITRLKSNAVMIHPNRVWVLCHTVPVRMSSCWWLTIDTPMLS